MNYYEFKMEFIFVSPHFDDICFSLDGFVNKFKNFDKRIINVFTRSDYIRRMRLICSDQNLREDIISNIRKVEDDNYTTKYGFSYKENLNLKDCGSFGDREKELLESTIIKLIKNVKKPILVFPIGVGLHQDHVKVFNVCRNIVESKEYKFDYIIYEDLPYSHVKKDRFSRVEQLSDFLKKNNLFYYKNLLNINDIKNKRDSIMLYESQHVYKNSFFVKMRRYCQRECIFSKRYEGMWINNENGYFSF